jgi:hypothetical protein
MTGKPSNEQIFNTEKITDAQKEMRINYADGSIGVLVSGFIWLFSAAISLQYSGKLAVWVLFLGGMFIFPLGMLLSKILGLKATHSKGNLLGTLAMEGTILMLICIPLAILMSFQKTEWFFQGMLLIIGGRYFTFNTIYGIKLYWILGATLGLAGYLSFVLKISAFGTLITGSLIEICFGLFMFLSFRKNQNTKAYTEIK